MSLMNTFKSWLGVMTLAALSACGGGGGSAGDSLFPGQSGGGTATPAVANVQVVFTPRQISNSGTETVQAAVTVTDSTGKGMAAVPVAISVDKDATYSTTAQVTDASGRLTATVTIGANYDSRTIVFTAQAGSVSRTYPLEVVGTSNVASDLILTAPTNELLNSPNNTLAVTARAVNFNRNAMPGIPVTFRVEGTDAAVIAASSSLTANDGTLVGSVSIGSDRSSRVIRIRASSGSVVRFFDIQVTGSKLTGQASKTILQPSESASVVYSLVDTAGSKMALVPYTVATPAGTVLQSGQTDNNGEFRYNFVAPLQTGSVTFVATAGGVGTSSTFSVEAAAAVPAADVVVNAAAVSASPSVVAVNTAGSFSNKVTIRALFQSASNAPVRNVRVWFDLGGDPSSIGGVLDNTATGRLLYSDVNGIVTTNYAPATRFSPKDGVVVRACWSRTDFAVPAEGGTCPNAVTTTLTVISESLSVTIGTNGTIEQGAAELTYIKRYVVQVVDSAGNARAGVTISPSVDVLAYFKGQYVPGVVSGGGASTPRWVPAGEGNTYPEFYPASEGGAAVTYTRLPNNVPDPTNGYFPLTVCENEDLNRNGVNEEYFDVLAQRMVKEDQNGSLNLQPGRPALDPRKADITITTIGSNVTNADGIVILKLEYPQNVASWVQFNILVSASGVAGTEGRANFAGQLQVLAAHVNDLASSPAFQFSPYGTGGSRTYRRRDAQGNTAWICTDPN